jgi:hypothetical protein
VDHKNVDRNKIRAFFGHDQFDRFGFENFQSLDRAGLQGRVLSASYMPMADHPNYPAMLGSVDRLFERFKSDRHVRIDYDTDVYVGQIS